MVKHADDNKSLPANRAFVVQFYQSEKDGKVSFEGRAEHLDTGQVKYFSSQISLCKIIKQMLINTSNKKSSCD